MALYLRENRDAETKKEPKDSPGGPESVWSQAYPGMSYENIKAQNPFATRSWLKQNHGKKGSRDRKDDIENLFDGKEWVDEERISELGSNKGKYAAFRAIVHEYAVWQNERLVRTNKL